MIMKDFISAGERLAGFSKGILNSFWEVITSIMCWSAVVLAFYLFGGFYGAVFIAVAFLYLIIVL